MRFILLGAIVSALLAAGAARAQDETAPSPAPDAAPQAETAPPAPAESGESAPAPADWAARASAAFAAGFAESCAPADGQQPVGERAPEVFEHAYRMSFDAPEDPERKAVLYRFLCGQAAYNETHVHYLLNDEILQLVSFAEPAIHVDYENEESDGKVLGINIIGLRAQNLVVNSIVDPKTLSVTSFNKWRGLGDASSSGVWLFKDGEYVLSTFEVDASYDGEINPQMLADYRKENEALGETP